MEHWAEIRRLHRAEKLGIKTIARRLGLARNTVRAALACEEPPKYRRQPTGSLVDAFVPAIRALLSEFPDMPASVIAERVGWAHSSSVLRAKVAELRPLHRPSDPADRSQYEPGEIVQCDLWFPPKIIPVGGGRLVDPPVLMMVAAYSRFITGLMLPSRTSGDLMAGMWQLLSASVGAVPKVLVWDNEAGIGQHHRLTSPARSFAGTLGIRIYQTAARDPEAKGVVERANGFMRTSFLPGRTFTGPADFNTQMAAWLPKANTRLVRATGARPVDLLPADRAAMGVLPPVPPRVGVTTRVRLARDYYVRVAGNDYSVDPTMIGRFVDVQASLTTVTITCAGQVVGAHERSWTARATITDPAHVASAALLRRAHQTRLRATGAAPVAAGTVVGRRALSDYDDLFAIAHQTPNTDTDTLPSGLQVAR